MAHIVTDENFEQEVLKSDLPVLVDFFAEWCGPCKMLGPIIDELSGEYDGKWKIVKVDIDASPAIAEKYGIQSIPSLKYFKGGEIVNEDLGFKAKDAIKAKLDS
ncbi:thioredoxin [Candidatus Peregrinibacteria bacterium]|nr:thioredoxin [Candidatus Peregrinibacteria bacterium]